MYLITAYFDDKTNKILQRHIDKVAAITKNTFMTDNHVPPHMTVLSVEAKSAALLLPSFQRIAAQVTTGNITIATVGALLPYVIYVAPVYNEYLDQLIKTAYRCMPEDAKIHVSRYYRPMQWMPHITLGKKLDKEQMKQAFEVLQDSFQVMDARVVSLGLSRVNPHEDIAKMDLL